ncbi:MAG: carboxypeptidase-like regulatory domain-containing protein [Flavobacteriaceae bacterium]|nr:carboxypeptidase-like regulatory domain-containing protein [Flavobacteriaceae bacterium]
MKTTILTNNVKRNYLLVSFIFAIFFSVQNASAQKVTVKGVVKGKTELNTELLMGVNIYLKDKSAITTSNRKGEFTFPQELNVGDILVFSYLGFIKKEIKVTRNSTNLTVILQEDDNEMLGAPNTNKRFSSKKDRQ